LRATIKSWDARLAKTEAGKRAGLLDSLAAGSGVESGRRAAAPDNRLRRKRRKVDEK
jgi:hypothetical protein